MDAALAQDNEGQQQQHHCESVSDPDASSSRSSGASSTSTQWPSAPSSPSSQNDVTHLQDVLDRALHDPFSTHPEVTAHLKSNIEGYCLEAAQKIYNADVLLVITGAGFSADSGLATYADVADIDAYRDRGWKYRDLCKPPTFTDFSFLDGEGKGGGEEDGCVQKAKVDVGKEREIDDECGLVEADEIDFIDDFREPYYRRHLNHIKCKSLPDEDDINHPQYFYGFWGQCCNDYRRVKPHEGYDIIARWGKDKNAGTMRECSDDNKVASKIREITRMLEQGNVESGDSSDSSIGLLQFKEDDEEEPYYVSQNKRAGAFFLFTSNVDAHSFDVIQSHEIRECHGNVELWQCHDFSCGTNATVNNGGSLDGSDDGSGDVGDDSDAKHQKQKDQNHKWERRLWRLPMDHKFLVDRQSMCAPYSKRTPSKKQSSSKASLPAPAVSAPPVSKRRKPSICEEIHENTGHKASIVPGFAPKHGACSGNSYSIDTATALGGMMEETMRNHIKKLEESRNSNENANQVDGDDQIPAHVGEVHGKPRLYPLKYMQPPTTDCENEGKDSHGRSFYLPISRDENWPICPRCNGLARPAVLMFDDLDWIYNLKQERRWQRWCHALMKLCKQRNPTNVENWKEDGSVMASDVDSNMDGNDQKSAPACPKEENIDDQLKASGSPGQPLNELLPPLKVAILEIGCGYNVPTCRVLAERLVGDLSMHGGDATLIRINPLHPEPDNHEIEPLVISIMEKGVVALKSVDERYRELVKGRSLDNLS